MLDTEKKEDDKKEEVKESEKKDTFVPETDSKNISIDDTAPAVNKEEKEEVKKVEEVQNKMEESTKKEETTPISSDTTVESSVTKSTSGLKSALKSENSSKKKARICFDALTSFLYMCQYGDPTEDPELPTVRKYLGIPLENGEEVKNVEIPDCFKDQIPISKEVLSSLYTAHNFLTPLHIAATYNQLGIVKLLVEYADAPVNIQDVEGWTPLHCACAEGNFDIVEYLGRCTKRKYYENALKQTESDEEETEEDTNKYRGYTNDYHIFEYTEKNPIIMRKPNEKQEESEEDDDEEEEEEEGGEEEEEEEEDAERYAEICDDYITITDDIYRLLLKESNGVKDTDPDKPAIYCVDGPILLDILNEDGNNAYEVCQEDPKGQLIQMHLKNLIKTQQELVKLAIEKKENEQPEEVEEEVEESKEVEKNEYEKNEYTKSKLSELIYTTTLNDVDDYENEEEEGEGEGEGEENEDMEEDDEEENKEKSKRYGSENDIRRDGVITPTGVKINDMSEITNNLPSNHKIGSKNNIMVEVVLNSLDKKCSSDEIHPLNKRNNMEKRLSESLDNLKFDKNEIYYYDNSSVPTNNENHHARPTSLMLPRGLCGSDMALNAKGNKRIIPAFNLSLTEGGIKPFSRGHRNNNVTGPSVSFGTGTQSFCYSPGVTSPNNDANLNKLYRRSVQAYSPSNNNYISPLTTEFDFASHKNRNADISPTKQTNSELESYTNNSFKDTSVDSSNGGGVTRRRSFSNRTPGKILNVSNMNSSVDANGINNNNNNIKEETELENKETTKISNESLKSNQSDKSDKSDKNDKTKSKEKNRTSTNSKKLFFLSFKSKKKNNEEKDEQPPQQDILVSTMKKRYEKNSSKAQK
ncbi:hypothetical protein PIROE2DRAFT_62195 [Piromyces sp. E2]|nr:hypothetical protein PIROE2DRAFT_62195 [Piromyces sp. E2]|eukprot:OUM61960.1 hypothetical protein PIROE2DRAFT_62195 [Piromyces sp. E2]